MTRQSTSIERIKRFSDRIAVRYKPERIILFGSHARNGARWNSDVDILLVFPRVGRPARKSAEILVEMSPDFPVDLIVRSSRDLKRRVEEGDYFLKEIVEQGKILHEASHV